MCYLKEIFFQSVLICRRYVPEVRHLPNQYVHEPWKAPLSIQKEARCVVGLDYPARMCDHIKQRQICVQKLRDHSRELSARSKFHILDIRITIDEATDLEKNDIEK